MTGYTINYTYINKQEEKKFSHIYCSTKQDTIQKYNNLENNLRKKQCILIKDQTDIIDNTTNKSVSIKDLQECTQPGMVSGGRVDVFTNNGSNFDKDDWYKQLFELDDYNI